MKWLERRRGIVRMRVFKRGFLDDWMSHLSIPKIRGFARGPNHYGAMRIVKTERKSKVTNGNDAFGSTLKI